MRQFRYAVVDPKTGRACCAADWPDHPLCPRCAAQQKSTAAPAPTAAETFPPPDPYAKGIEALRAENAAVAARTYPPAPRPSPQPTSYTPPDPYKLELERLRREENRR
jgi:hypothetical protein